MKFDRSKYIFTIHLTNFFHNIIKHVLIAMGQEVKNMDNSVVVHELDLALNLICMVFN